MKALNWGIFKAALFFTIHSQTEIKVICGLPFFFLLKMKMLDSIPFEKMCI